MSQLSQNDPLNPSIPFIFQQLYSCVMNMNGYVTCEQALEAAKQLQAQRPETSYETIQNEQIAKNLFPDYRPSESTLSSIKSEQEKIDLWEQKLKQLPLVLARDLLNTKNHQETYVLNSKDGKPLWIFKPDYQNCSLNETNEDTAVCEHTASLLSEGKFPIPKTIYIELKKLDGFCSIIC